MANKVYEIFTDLPPAALTEVAMETYRIWLEFALGKEEIGGKVLTHPSGRYAASMSWKRTGQASVAIIADESIAPEVGWIEEGRPASDMKAKMLGQGKTRTAADGHKYRIIPMRRDATAPDFDIDDIVSSAAGERLPTRAARMWARPRSQSNPSRFRTMTDKPGSAAWIVPAMPAYAPAAILASLIRRDTHGR